MHINSNNNIKQNYNLQTEKNNLLNKLLIEKCIATRLYFKSDFCNKYF